MSGDKIEMAAIQYDKSYNDYNSVPRQRQLDLSSDLHHEVCLFCLHSAFHEYLAVSNLELSSSPGTGP